MKRKASRIENEISVSIELPSVAWRIILNYLSLEELVVVARVAKAFHPLYENNMVTYAWRKSLSQLTENDTRYLYCKNQTSLSAKVSKALGIRHPFPYLLIKQPQPYESIGSPRNMPNFNIPSWDTPTVLPSSRVVYFEGMGIPKTTVPRLYVDNYYSSNAYVRRVLEISETRLAVVNSDLVSGTYCEQFELRDDSEYHTLGSFKISDRYYSAQATITLGRYLVVTIYNTGIAIYDLLDIDNVECIMQHTCQNAKLIPFTVIYDGTIAFPSDDIQYINFYDIPTRSFLGDINFQQRTVKMTDRWVYRLFYDNRHLRVDLKNGVMIETALDIVPRRQNAKK